MSTSTPPRQARIEGASFVGPHLRVEISVDGHRFATSWWYQDLDLEALAAAGWSETLWRTALHLALIEAAKLSSLRLATLDLGPLAQWCTPATVELFRVLFRRIWAQWRYEHDLPDERGPEIIGAKGSPGGRPDRGLPRGATETLMFAGGGKDSLVAAHLLSQAGIAFDSLAYAHAIYGEASMQHRLIDGMLDRTGVKVRRRQWIADETAAVPLPQLLPEYGARSITAAETPSSVLAAIPLALAHGYRTLVLAHERSANVGNLVWSRTGEDVNHQWGKSLEAEQLLGAHIAQELVPELRIVGLLQPIHDVVIFELLGQRAADAAFTHSCNVHKPWCARCPKCAYVALGMAAHLPDGAYERVFGREDPLDLPENDTFFEEMLGLGEHTPFECIGEIDEARLAVALCAARGRNARAIERHRDVRVDLDRVLSRYATAYDTGHGIPGSMDGVLPLMRAAAGAAQRRIRAVLRG